MEIAELLKDNKTRIWISEYKNKPNTQRNYLQAMKFFTDFTGKSPSQLIDEAKNDIRAGKFMDERAIFEDFTLFNGCLLESKLAPKTRATHITGVKSFFKKFYIELPQIRNAKKVKPLAINKKVPSKEDLQEVLAVCSPLEKCLVLVGCTSGLSAEEIRNLKLEDYFRGYDKNDEIATLQLRRTKTETDFITFLSPEATTAINTYLQYRERILKAGDIHREKSLKKQRITRNEKGEAVGYLFINEHVPNDYAKTQNEELRQLSHNGYMKIYQRIATKAQKNTPSGDWGLIRSHNMRRYFYSSLVNAGADIFAVEFLSGHTLPDSQSAYFIADANKLKEIYKKYIPYLTIEKSLDVSVSPEYQKLADENRRLVTEVARVSVERIELEKLKNAVADIEKTYRANWNTPVGFEIGKTIKKIHPNRLILIPNDQEREQ